MEKYACVLCSEGADVNVNILYAWIISNEFKWFVMFPMTILSLCGTPVVPRQHIF